MFAVGDSYNDVTMLKTANNGILFTPCSGLVESLSELPIVWNLQELKAELHKCLTEIL